MLRTRKFPAGFVVMESMQQPRQVTQAGSQDVEPQVVLVPSFLLQAFFNVSGPQLVPTQESQYPAPGVHCTPNPSLDTKGTLGAFLGFECKVEAGHV